VHAAAISPPRATADERSSSSDAVVALQLFAIAVMVFPSDMVIKPIGAVGYPASLFGIVVFGVYFVSVLFGLHQPTRHSHPIRGMLCVVWVALLASYILMDRGRRTGIEIASADRALIRYAVVAGVALVAAEWLRSLHDTMRVVRVLCWGGAFCGFVAVLQYWIGFDLAHYLRQMPGFTVNHDYSAIMARGGQTRVAGTALHPIELGVVMGMLIPVAVCLGLYDRDKPPIKRWAPLALITLGVATSVSRSAILSVVVAFVILLVLLPPVQRLAALAALPVAMGGIFMSAHGLIGTLASFFAGASNDPSIQYRTHDYPLAERLWQSAPFLGRGPGTWIPADSLNIFDNQYLGTIVEQGSVGLVALVVLLLGPAIAALTARRRSASPDVRLLCAAVAGAGAAATVSSLTFDSLSFPMFVNVHAILIGLAGACWRLVAAEQGEAKGTIRGPALGAHRIQLVPPGRYRPRRAES
jgi:hypothetical protein